MQVSDPKSLLIPDLKLEGNLVAKGALAFFKTLAPQLTVLNNPYLQSILYTYTIFKASIQNSVGHDCLKILPLI